MRYLAFVALAVLVAGCVKQAETAQTPAPSGPMFRTDLISCSYDIYADGKNRFNLFFRVINVGESPTKVPAQVCLTAAGGPRPHCINLNEAYPASRILFGEINWTGGRRGQMWHIESDSKERQDVDYTLFYTEDPNNLENGAVKLISGRTDICGNVTH